jgi:ribonucleoside-diphosphate reductase alpha chain
MDDLAASVWLNKYALKSGNKFIEDTPDKMHRRMAVEFFKAEKNLTRHDFDKTGLSKYGITRQDLTEDAIFELFDKFKYIVPQGSIMSILGNPNAIGSLSNCIVLPEVYDSYGGIMYTDQQQVQLMKRRCGVGIDVSTLRPADTKVTNAAGTSTGPISFMHRFSNTTREVAQNGRRGALMLTIDVRHPDVERFITVKQDRTSVTGANISVKITDDFMNAVMKNEKFTLKWPVESAEPKITKEVNAKEVWASIIKAAHGHAEPGIIFWDRQHEYSTSSVYPGYRNVSTNPCSEIAMQGGDSCRLVAINMYSFVKNPFTALAEFDFEKFYEVTYESMRIMDDLVELELWQIDKILKKVDTDDEPDYIKEVERRTWKLLRESGERGRRTGLGFTGLADAIAALSIKFGTHESLNTIDKIMRVKLRAEFDSSIDMAIERGKFADFDPKWEFESDFVVMLSRDFSDIFERMMKYGRRNISISTVAPTGTVSLLTQTSSGIEPIYDMSYVRSKKITGDEADARIDRIDEKGDKWQEFTVYHHKLNDWMRITGETDISKSPYAGATASVIDWTNRVKLQGIVQKYVTHSISSTVNLPKNVSIDLVAKIYEEAWREGLKGITVYRDGSRDGVLNKIKDEVESDNFGIITRSAPKRPKDLPCELHHVTAVGIKWLVIIGMMKSKQSGKETMKPFEVFAFPENKISVPDRIKTGIMTRRKKGVYDLICEGQKYEDITEMFDKHEHEIITRGASLSLRHGADIQFLHEQYDKSEGTISSFGKALARTFKKYIIDGKAPSDKKCPNCDDPNGLEYKEGCLICKSCGYGKC